MLKNYDNYVVGRFLENNRIELVKVSEDTCSFDYNDVQIINIDDLSKQEVFDILAKQVREQRQTIDFLEDELNAVNDLPIALASEQEMVEQAMIEASFEKFLH